MEPQLEFPTVERLVAMNERLSEAAHREQLLAVKWQGIATALYECLKDIDQKTTCHGCALQSFERAIRGEE
jgi:hypothetical protein